MELLYKGETEKIIGVMYDVYNELGYGYREKYYERAIIKRSEKKTIEVKAQLCLPVKFMEEQIGYSMVDLLFFNLILVELKVGKSLTMKDFDQINEYLKLLDKEIGLLILYSPNGVVIRRVANLKDR